MQYVFRDVKIDLDRFELLRDGSPQPVQPRVLDLIVYLLRHRKRVVSRQELLLEVWHGITVSNAALSQAVMEARRVVGDHADIQDVIRTVRGRGYQVIAEVEEHGHDHVDGLALATRQPSPVTAAPFCPQMEHSELMARIDDQLTSLRSESSQVLLVACKRDSTSSLLATYAEQARQVGGVTLLALLA